MTIRYAAAIAAMAVGAPASAAETDPLAAMFGARENVLDISLSPDGQHIAYLTPGPDRSTVLMILNIAGSTTRAIGSSNAEPLRLSSCGWSSNTRLVCKLYGMSKVVGQRVSFSRTLGFDLDGKNVLYLGRRTGSEATRPN